MRRGTPNSVVMWGIRRLRAVAVAACLVAGAVSPSAHATSPTATITVAATRAGCGTVDLPAGARLDVPASLGAVRSGYRALYLVGAGHEPAAVLATRARLGDGSLNETVFGASGALPRGRYRLCVITDHPQRTTVRVVGLPHAVRLDRLTGIAAHAFRPALSAAGAEPRVAVTELATLRTTVKSVLLVVGTMSARPKPAGAYDVDTCLEGRADDCPSSEPLFGAGTRSVNGTRETLGDYWPVGEAGAGRRVAGLVFRGTFRPERMDTFVLQLET
jgi:hypothetical protein